MFPGSTTKAFEGFGIGRPISLVEEDARIIAKEVDGVDRISPEYSYGDVQVRLGENIINTLVAGVYPVYAGIRNINPQAGGRFIDDVDMQDRKRVALIGDAVKDLLFGEGEAIGKLITVGGIPFTVVGVMQKKTQPSSYNRRDMDRVFIPASTFASVFGEAHLRNIVYTHKDPSQSEAVNDQVRSVLGKRYRFDPADHDAIWIWDTSEFDKFSFNLFLGINIFMGLIGSFTLAVGGIGVANIMYIVVQERIREIGIKRAVGATKGGILFQFFLETFFIVALGSTIGFLIALGITQVMQYLPIKEYVGTPEISIGVALATVGVLSVVALAAGFFPARRAANLNVVDCLRT
jgi:putative ABC transport system permease protein